MISAIGINNHCNKVDTIELMKDVIVVNCLFGHRFSLSVK